MPQNTDPDQGLHCLLTGISKKKQKKQKKNKKKKKKTVCNFWYIFKVQIWGSIQFNGYFCTVMFIEGNC